MRFKRATLMSLSALLLVSAVKPYSPPAALAQSAATPPVSARPVHWGYDGNLGPAKWSRLSPAYAACAGRQQSPIDLSDPGLQATSPWKVNYKTTGLTLSHHEHVTDILDNGHTIQVSVEAGSTLVTDRDTYELKQFHFHTPSEHTLHGKALPLEAHFVHQSASGRFAVIAVLFVAGNSNPNLAMLIANFPSARGDTRFVPGVQLDLALHLPKDNVAYSYLGSFTTPPCTENVEWLVFRDPVAASAAQLSAFADRLHHNNRPIQPTRQRPIRTGSVVGTSRQP